MSIINDQRTTTYTPTTRPDAEVIDPDYPVTPVPAHARKSLTSLFLVLLGFTVFTPTMLAGAEIGTAFTAAGTLGVIVLGSLILGVYVTVIGWIGARTGLTTVIMARYSLGTSGAKIASVLLGATQIGWYGVVIGTVGTLTAEAFTIESRGAVIAIMIASSAFMCITACFGYHGMYWVSAISTPLILVLAVWVAYRCLEEVGGLAGLFALEPTDTMPLAMAVTTVVGTFVAAGTQAPNWTRFAKTGRHAIIACVGGFLVGNTAMLIFGAIGAVTFGEGDFVVILYSLGMVLLGVLLMFGNLWKSNADTAYAFGVAGAEIASSKSKTPFVIGGSIIGTLLAVAGVQDHLVGFLTLLGVFIPPLGGVIIGDYLARWRVTQMPENMALPKLRLSNLVIYVVASAAAWLSNITGVGIAPLVGIVVAVVLAWGAHRVPPSVKA